MKMLNEKYENKKMDKIYLMVGIVVLVLVVSFVSAVEIAPFVFTSEGEAWEFSLCGTEWCDECNSFPTGPDDGEVYAWMGYACSFSSIKCGAGDHDNTEEDKIFCGYDALNQVEALSNQCCKNGCCDDDDDGKRNCMSCYSSKEQKDSGDGYDACKQCDLYDEFGDPGTDGKLDSCWNVDSDGDGFKDKCCPIFNCGGSASTSDSDSFIIEAPLHKQAAIIIAHLNALKARAHLDELVACTYPEDWECDGTNCKTIVDGPHLTASVRPLGCTAEVCPDCTSSDSGTINAKSGNAYSEKKARIKLMANAIKKINKLRENHNCDSGCSAGASITGVRNLKIFKIGIYNIASADVSYVLTCHEGDENDEFQVDLSVWASKECKNKCTTE